jgi:hypothetical protein
VARPSSTAQSGTPCVAAGVVNTRTTTPIFGKRKNNVLVESPITSIATNDNAERENQPPASAASPDSSEHQPLKKLRAEPASASVPVRRPLIARDYNRLNLKLTATPTSIAGVNNT